MVASLKEIDPSFADSIDETVLLRQSPRPATGKQIFQRLGFSNSSEGITENALDQFESAKRDFAVCLDPMTQILAEFGVKHRLAITALRQVVTPGAVGRRSLECPCEPLPGEARSAVVAHSWETATSVRFL